MKAFTKVFTKKVLKETKLFSVIWRDNPMFAARRLGIVFSLCGALFGALGQYARRIHSFV